MGSFGFCERERGRGTGKERKEILQIKFENFTGPPVSIRNNRILQKKKTDLEISLEVLIRD